MSDPVATNKWTIKSSLTMLSLIVGPFLTIGVITYYRRVLEWWYIHGIAMDPELAGYASVAVTIFVSFFVAVTIFIHTKWWDKI